MHLGFTLSRELIVPCASGSVQFSVSADCFCFCNHDLGKLGCILPLTSLVTAVSRWDFCGCLWLKLEIWYPSLHFCWLPEIGRASPVREKPSASKTDSGAQRMVQDKINDIKFFLNQEKEAELEWAR
jgi:hypothetical protein